MQKILIEPQGGLCNRMRAIHSALALADALDRPLELIWMVNLEVGARFDQLFEPIPAISRVTSFIKNRPTVLERAHYLWSCRMPFLSSRPNVLSDDVIQMVENGSDFQELGKLQRLHIRSCSIFMGLERPVQAFQPVADIKKRVAETVGKFDRTIGVHIRRTDNVKAISESPTSAIFDALEREIENDPDVTFFLATDDLSEKSAASARFGDRILSADTQSFERDQADAVKSAAVELYCLAACEKIIGCAGSSFTAMAARLGGLELVIARGSVDRATHACI